MGGAVKRAFTYRFYPTPQQADQLNRTFGCVRKVYNLALDAHTRAWTTEHRPVSYGETSAMLTAWKREADLAYLGEVSCVPLQQALRHLHAAYAAFFAKRSRYPRLKSKRRSRASAEYTRSAFRYRDGQLTLAKQDRPLAIVWSRPLPEGAQPSTVTVSRDHANRWFVVLLVADPTVRPLPPVDTAVGVDAGITSLVTLSAGEKVTNPRHDRARWYGRTVIAVDRWFPSSRTCCVCGRLAESMPLHIRQWTCPCGAVHDRDVNAARNILAAGLADR